jgi:hypothetical protein
MSNHRKWSWMAFVAVLFMPLPASADYFARSVITWDADALDFVYRNYVSEEYPPITCASGDLIAGALCDGSYCDNIYALCVHFGYVTNNHFWYHYVSEESSYFETYCWGGFLTGLACKGDYCDSISI